APFLVSVGDYFGVAARVEPMAPRRQASAQFSEVVNLAVLNGCYLARLIRHRLMTHFEVDDGESADAECRTVRAVQTLVIGTAVGDGRQHLSHQVFRTGRGVG